MARETGNGYIFAPIGNAASHLGQEKIMPWRGDFWVSVGNEVTGTGHPKEDAMELAKHGRIANAKYGAGGSTSFAAAVNKGRR